MVEDTRWSPEALYEHFDDKIDQLQAYVEKRFTALTEDIERRARDQKTAIDKAETAATALAKTHNDLIRKGERDAANYATKDEFGRIMEAVAKLQSFQSKILGALALAAVIVPTITGIVVYIVTKGSVAPTK